MKNIKKTFAVKLATMALMAATLAPTCAMPVMAATRNDKAVGCLLAEDNGVGPFVHIGNAHVFADYVWNGR